MTGFYRDPYNYVELQPSKKALSQVIASRERSAVVTGAMKTLPDPDEVLKKRGGGISILRSLTTDTQVWSNMSTRKSGVKSLEWGINRGFAQDKNAELIETILKNLDMPSLIDNILEAPFFGYQPLEIIWQADEGLIVPVSIVAKPPEWFTFDLQGQLRFKSKENRDGEELPPGKFLLPRYKATYANPYGERILSRCFWPVTFKKGGLKFWVVFMERYGMPMAIAKHPRGSDKKETDELADIMENMIQDAIAVIPDDSSIELKESPFKASSSGIYQDLIRVCEEDISKVILGQTLTTQVGDTGSYAASQTHNDVRKEIVDDDKHLVESSINDLIRIFYQVNFPQLEPAVFEMWAHEDVDITLAQRDETLYRAGVRFSKKYLQKAYGFEEEDIEISQAEEVQPQQFSEQAIQASKAADPQQVLDALMESFTDTELQNQIEPMLNPVLKFIENTSNYEELMADLAEQYPDMDDLQFQEKLAQAIFISDVYGRLSAQEE
jgi:phage gp29-like protein